MTPSTTGGPGTLYRIFAPDVRPQLTKQWNIFVERKLTNTMSGQIGYVGSRSTHMVVPFDFNQPEPGPGPVDTWLPLAQRRPLYQLNPDLGYANSGTNSIGVGKYDALQASVRERYSDGLEFMASYTYGKALSDNIGYYGVGWGQTAVQGFYYMDNSDPLRDYGPSPYDVRHLFSIAANYELPVGKGKKHNLSGPADFVLGGWRLNTIYQAHTGLALTVTDSAGQSLQATRSNERPDRSCTGNTNASGPDDIWIDSSCFSHAAVGQFGELGRRHPARARLLERRLRPEQGHPLRRVEVRDVQDRSLQRLQSSQLRDSAGRHRHRRSEQLRPYPQHLLGAAHRRTGAEVHVLIDGRPSMGHMLMCPIGDA